ncbi:MAG: YlmC/YmxH family sporulation protein [Firmicutes bacterium]|nr:YlmC/YmxH family sporulation protein [Bacillota bacterium]
MLVRISDLRTREVVNVVDGRRLGPICDMEIDLATGQVKAIMVPGPARLMGILGRYNDYVIPWERIRRIGLDVILVEASEYAEPPKQ